MTQSSSNFKLILVTAFVGAAVLGMLVFAGIIKFGNSGTEQIEGSVTLWGTLDSRAMNSFMNDYNQRNSKLTVTYVEKNPETFAQSLVEAIASGTAPDLVLLSDSYLYTLQDKLTLIPYTSLPVRTYQDTFISGAGIFTVPEGILALPWAADPIVMYYNKTMLEGASMAKPPRTWQEFSDSIPLLTQKQSDLTLTQSGAALGTFKNVAHAKDILALLFYQGGSSFITRSSIGLEAHFRPDAGDRDSEVPVSVLDFYMAFADPVKQVYSWNNGQVLDRDAFLTSSLAYYFGYGSELPGIRAENPNLNFDVTPPPQPQAGSVITTGRIYGIAIPKTAPDQLLSYTAATLLADAASAKGLVEKAGTELALMPVRRDVLAEKPAADPYLTLFYNAALVTKPWLDLNPKVSDEIFGALINDINSGILTVDQALAKAAAQIASRSIRGAD